VVSVLSVLGAIGYIVMVDVWLLIRKRKKEMTFTSRIILMTTALLWVAGILLLSLDGFAFKKRGGASILHYIFQSMTALTTVGFNTIPISGLRPFSLFVLLVLMIIGASPSGTGGGIKSTTISCLAGVVKGVLARDKEYIGNDSWAGRARRKKGKSGASEADTRDESRLLFADVFKIKIMKQAIPFGRVLHAIATFTFYFAILFLGVLLLLLREPFPLEQILFEAASALGTVGLSTGITSSLSGYGKAIIILLMFIGRLGPITFGIFLFSRSSSAAKNGSADIVI
jgi:trk system potassium uptake protein TrkH